MEDTLLKLANQSVLKSDIKRSVKSVQSSQSDEIAIVGIAGRIGDAEGLPDFFEKLLNNYDFIKDLPEGRKEDATSTYKLLYPNVDLSNIKYAKGGYLNHIDKFDYEFFGIPYIEIQTMDPTQRAIFETVMESIWDAGYTEKQLNNTKTGVYVGNSNTSMESYKQLILECDESVKDIALAGNLNSVLSSRISYYLNLKGASMVIDTACSSGLVALHIACEDLKSGKCKMAIVAGAKIHLIPPINQDSNLAICSKDGYTRTFDDRSSGTGIGEGAVSLILKPLSEAKKDKDQVYAVIKGSSINQDGKSVGITAPNAESQKNVLIEAWNESNINPCDIQYIEAHGTATKIGDVVEIESITNAFKEFTGGKQFCAIGSVKSNVGHTDSISGLVGLVKCVYALNEKKIPATLHFAKPNRQIDFINSPVYINHKCQEWKSRNNNRICCVSSFGLSGTNACVVLEEYKEDSEKKEQEDTRTLWLSAKTEDMLEIILRKYLEYVQKRPSINLSNLCYTVNERKQRYQFQIGVVFENYEGLVSELKRLLMDLSSGKTSIIQQVQNIDSAMYHDSQCISVPAYPLRRKRCWIENTQDSSFHNEKKNGLIADLLISTVKEDIYEIKMSIENHWQLGEHKVKDKYLLVGTSYIEIITEIAKKYYGIHNVEICNLILFDGLYTKNQDIIEFHIYVQPKVGEYEFEMASRQDGVVTIHCQGVFNSFVAVQNDAIDIQSILSQIDETMKISPEIYLYGLVSISDRWHVTKNIFIGEEYYVAEIETPKAYIKEAGSYILYPTILDAALNFSNTLQGSGAYLPWQYGKTRIHSPIPNKVYSVITVKEDKGSKEVLKFDVLLTDMNGNIVAETCDYVVKRTHLNNDLEKKNLHFSKRVWERLQNVPLKTIKQKKTIIFGYQSERGHYSNKEGLIYINIKDIDGQLKDVFSSEQGVERIIFDCCFMGLTIENPEHWKELYNRSYIKFTELMKVIVNSSLDKLQEIMVIVKNGYKICETDSIENVFGASLSASLKSLKFEYPKYKFRYIDCDEFALREIWDWISLDIDTISVGIRKSVLYKEEIVAVDSIETKQIEIEQEGTYLITGGLGGVGLTAARTLAQMGAGNIILLGRTLFEDISEAADRKYSALMNIGDVIKEIQVKGTNLVYISTDVSDLEQLNDTVRKVAGQYGQINGIIHAAGVPGEGLFFNKKIEDMKRVLDVKVLGTLGLFRVINELELSPKFIIGCSSSTALLGSIGQWDYAAANEFINLFSVQRDVNDNTRYMSVMWPTWSEVGMAYNYGFKEDECIFEPIDNNSGNKYFKFLVEAHEPELIVGRWNNKLIRNESIKLNISFYNGRPIEMKNGSDPDPDGSNINEITLDAILQQVSKLWVRVLGRDDIDENDKFFELEGDSILATYLLTEINNAYNNIFDITDIFTYSSIWLMSEAIYKKVVKPTKPTSVSIEESELDELLQDLFDGKVTVDEIKTKI